MEVSKLIVVFNLSKVIPDCMQQNQRGVVCD